MTSGLGAALPLALLRLHRTGKLRLAVAFAVGVPLVLAVARGALAGDGDAAEAFEGAVRWAFFGLLAFVLPYVLGAGIFAEEIERRTIAYALTRPTPRPTLALARLLAVFLPSAALVLVGLLVLHVGVFAAEPSELAARAPHTLRVAGALVLLVAYYAAAATFWSVALPEMAYVVVALHFGLLEFLFGMAPGVLRVVSMNFLAAELAGLERVGLLADRVPEIPAPLLVGVLAAFALGAAALTALVTQLAELHAGGKA